MQGPSITETKTLQSDHRTGQDDRHYSSWDYAEALYACKEQQKSEAETCAVIGLLMMSRVSNPITLPGTASRSPISEQDTCSSVSSSDTLLGSGDKSDSQSDYSEDVFAPSPPIRKRNRAGMTKRALKASPGKRDRVEVKDCLAEKGPVKKRVKTISPAAQKSKAWCHQIKFMPAKDLPDCMPPRAIFEQRGHLLPQRASSAAAQHHAFDPSKADKIAIDPSHPSLSIQEQRFVAMVNGLDEQHYLDCKRRIFACTRWRTEEDGVFHNKESSQQCCTINVNVTSIIHDWFDRMRLFNRPWNLEKHAMPRPPHMGHLDRQSEGRNGRCGRKTLWNQRMTTEEVLEKYKDTTDSNDID